MSNVEPSLISRIIKAVGQLVRAPIEVLSEFLSDVVDSDQTIRNSHSSSERISAWLTLPWRMVVAMFTFLLFSWSSTRSASAFFLGIPALAVLGGYVGALFAADMIYGEAKTVAANEAYYQFHSKNLAEHPEWSGIFARRLVELKPTSNRYKYMLADALDRSGEPDRAMNLMYSISPLEAPGYVPGHSWLADKLLKQLSQRIKNAELLGEEPSQITDPEFQRNDQWALRHLLLAVNEDRAGDVQPQDAEQQAADGDDETGGDEGGDDRKEPDFLEPRRLGDADVGKLPNFNLGRYYYQKALLVEKDSGEYFDWLKKSEAQFGIVVNDDDATRTKFGLDSLQPWTKIRLELAEKFPADYDRKETQRIIENRLDTLFVMTKTRFQNSAFLWQVMARTALELEDYERVQAILRTGLELTTDQETNVRLRSSLASAQVAIAKRIKNLNRRANYRARLQVLCQAVGNNSSDRMAYSMLLDFIGGEETPVDPETGVAIVPDNVGDPEQFVPVRLRWLLAEGAGSRYGGIIYAMVGLHKISNGDVLVGRKNWRVGDELNDRVQDNISFLLDVAAKEKEGKFENMLDMITLAIEMFAEKPQFYLTRGNFLKSKQRFDEAVSDFQHFVDAYPDNPIARQQLKFCYERMGEQEKAAAEGEVIDRLLSEQTELERLQSEQILSRLAELEKTKS